MCKKKKEKKEKNAAGENAIVVHCRRVQVVQNSQKIGIQICTYIIEVNKIVNSF